jgi:hypothetical protein
MARQCMVMRSIAAQAASRSAQRGVAPMPTAQLTLPRVPLTQVASESRGPWSNDAGPWYRRRLRSGMRRDEVAHSLAQVGDQKIGT